MPFVSVLVAVPDVVKALSHVLDSIASFVTPRSLDVPVRNGYMRLLREFQSLPCSPQALNAAARSNRFDVILWALTTTRPRRMNFDFVLSQAAAKSAADKAVAADIIQLVVEKCSADLVRKTLKTAVRCHRREIAMAIATKANKIAIVDAFTLAAKKNWRGMTLLVASACPGIHAAHALEIALENGLDEEISILVDRGCGSIGADIFKVAIKYRRRDLLRIVAENCDTKSVPEAFKTALQHGLHEEAEILASKHGRSRPQRVATVDPVQLPQRS